MRRSEDAERDKTIIRYVLNASSPLIRMDHFPWETATDSFLVYRGQSGVPKMKASRSPENAANALSIETSRPRPLSTSTELRDSILKFASGWDADPPTGRLFQITIEPGVKFVDLKKWRTSAGDLRPDRFEFLKAELQTQADDMPAGSDENIAALAYAAHPLEFFWGKFFATLARENEVIIDPRGTTADVSPSPIDAEAPLYKTRIKLDATGAQMVKSNGEKVRETYKSDQTIVVKVYPTILRLRSSGGRRGRTFRRKPKRRNKNGSRFTRKSKHGRN